MLQYVRESTRVEYVKLALLRVSIRSDALTMVSSARRCAEEVVRCRRILLDNAASSARDTAREERIVLRVDPEACVVFISLSVLASVRKITINIAASSPQNTAMTSTTTVMLPLAVSGHLAQVALLAVPEVA